MIVAGLFRPGRRLPAFGRWVMFLAFFLAAASAADAQESTVSLSYSKELLYNIARDNRGEMNRDLVARLKGLSPSVTDVSIIRTGGEITLAYTVMPGEDLAVKFNLTLEKMAFYRMATAREDIDGMLEILRPAQKREPLILDLAYRFNERYSIVDVTIDLRPVIKERDERVREAAKVLAASVTPKKKLPPPKRPLPSADPQVAARRKAPPVTKTAPETKKKPYLQARSLGKLTPPTVDGRVSERIWREAEPFTFKVRGASGRFEVTMAALWGEDRLYVMARWPDGEENVDHRPWVWSEETREYLVGGQTEDAFALQFAKEGRLGECMLAGREAVADLWFWRAGRTNPSGFAEDGSLTVSATRIPKTNFYQAKNNQTMWVKEKRDAGTGPYRTRVAGSFEGAKVQRYVPREPSGSVADVVARGVWDKGTWTVEFSRRLDTGDPQDVVLKKGKTTYFSVAVFDRRERSEHSSSREFQLELE